MIPIYQRKVEIIQEKFRAKIDKQNRLALIKLKKINKNRFGSEEKEYLIKIIHLFENNNIVRATPSELINYCEDDNLNNVPENTRFYKNGKPKKKLYKYILDALNFTSLRSSFYPKYFNEIRIKACVYCNSQLTVSAIKDGNDYKAKFEVDHYYPKAKYPFLSISLFNLFPVCSSCNKAKKEGTISFNLYTDNVDKLKVSEYYFKLDRYSKAKYLTTKDSEVIEFDFIHKGNTINDLNEKFHIKEIYKTQTDVIEELIIKSQIYNQNYINVLKNSFNKLSLHPKLFKRMLVGNYTEEDEIHKRPMSKFMQDIAKDVGLI